MVFRRLLFVSLVLAFLTSLILAQKQNPSAQTKRESGLTVTTFETRRGTISVKLPDYMSAGDTISGTVVAEPAGKSDKEKQNNAAELNGYVIDIENQKARVSNGVIQRVHLLPDIDEPTLILLDGNGKPAGTVVIPLRPMPATIPSTVTLPALGQAGRPIQIQGPFDGDSSNTNVKLGDTPAKVLAESPRKLVVESPRDVVGPTVIKINENGNSTNGNFRNLKIDLTAPKTSLLKGESTELHVQVNGLEGLTQPVQVQLQNQSPSTVNINGGNTQTIPIQPSQVKPGGTFIWSTNVTGVGTGGFNITGSLPTGTTPPPTSSPATSKPTLTPIPTTTPLATTPPQTTPAATPSPTPVIPPPTHAIALPTPTEEEEFYNSFADVDSDCCKKLITGGVLSFSDGKGNGLQIDHDKVKMTIDGKTTEWQFTMNGKPLWLEWMFCHLKDDQVVAQLTQVMVQRIVDGKPVSETANTTSFVMVGPFRDEETMRPYYGFQFISQKIGTDVKEFAVSFSIDAKDCAWRFQLLAKDKVVEQTTMPPGSTHQIYNALTAPGLNNRQGYKHRKWWGLMLRHWSQIQYWNVWLAEHPDQDQSNWLQLAIREWRVMVQLALKEMHDDASDQDRSLIDQMLYQLNEEHPNKQKIIEIYWKFNDLWMRYGGPPSN